MLDFSGELCYKVRALLQHPLEHRALNDYGNAFRLSTCFAAPFEPGHLPVSNTLTLA